MMMITLKIKSFVILFLFIFILTVPSSQAITVTVNGDWYLTIDSSDLQGGAGTDLNPTYLSDTDQIRIDIRQTNTNWVVAVRGTVTNWHPDFQFGVRRTTDGTGPGSISGGTSWLQVTGSDQQFFTGYRRRTNIRIQCGLTGVSLQIPADIYSGTVIYTVWEQ